MKFEDMCNKIITEGKKPKVDGKKDKPEIIAEKDEQTVETTETQETVETQETPMLILDEIEKEFLEKFIEFTELTCIVKCQKTIEKDFKKILGKNGEAITEFLAEREAARNTRIDELKTELTTLRKQVRDNEKANVESAERKLSLVSLLDTAIKEE
jgi:hypothetical protein